MTFKTIAILTALIFLSNINPGAVKEIIISSKPDQLIYMLGQDHGYPTEDVRAI